MNLSSKKKVLSRYPDAHAEYLVSSTAPVWTIWDKSHKVREDLNKEYWPTTFGRVLLGTGVSEETAWKDAVRSIELIEGVRLPVE